MCLRVIAHPEAHVCLQLIAFNLGSLGFLTNHFYENFIRDLKGVIYGREELEQCSVGSEDGLAVRPSSSPPPSFQYRARLACHHS